jgi:hypothetical protein
MVKIFFTWLLRVVKCVCSLFFLILDMMTTSNTVSFYYFSKRQKNVEYRQFYLYLNKTTKAKKYRYEDPHCTVTVHTDLDDII